MKWAGLRVTWEGPKKHLRKEVCPRRVSGYKLIPGKLLIDAYDRYASRERSAKCLSDAAADASLQGYIYVALARGYLY